MLVLSHASFINKILVKYSMKNSKKDNFPLRHGITWSKQ